MTSGDLSFTYEYLPDSSLVREVTALEGSSEKFRQTYWHDTAGRLLGTKSEVPGTTASAITRHGYQLDALNRRTKTTLLDGSTWTWGYNDRSEVTSAIRKEPGGTEVPALGAGYQYDDIGNRQSSSFPIFGNLGYTPNELNQYGTITANDSRTAGSPRTPDGPARLPSSAWLRVRWCSRSW